MATNSKSFKIRNSIEVNGDSAIGGNIILSNGSGHIQLKSGNNSVYNLTMGNDGSLVAERIYSLGDTGPGGGTVFYDAGSVQSWGRYLEAAPNTWYNGSSDPQLVWSGDTTNSVSTQTSIGSGAANTANIIAQNNTADRAATAAKAYTGNGLSDWFLPSKDELNQLYLKRAVVGGFNNGAYFSSSQWTNVGAVWVQYVNTHGGLNYFWKRDPWNVRPIRAF